MHGSESSDSGSNEGSVDVDTEGSDSNQKEISGDNIQPQELLGPEHALSASAETAACFLLFTTTPPIQLLLIQRCMHSSLFNVILGQNKSIYYLFPKHGHNQKTNSCILLVHKQITRYKYVSRKPFPVLLDFFQLFGIQNFSHVQCFHKIHETGELSRKTLQNFTVSVL
jgi:hypothetical protein